MEDAEHGGDRRFSQRASIAQMRQRSKSVLQVLAGTQAESPVDDEFAVGLLEETNAAAHDDHSQARKSVLQNIGDEVAKKITNARQSTLFSPEVVEELARQDPETLSWMQSCWGLLAQFALVAFYVGIDVGKALFTASAMKGKSVQASSMLIMNSALSVVIGASMCVFLNGRQEFVRAITDFRTIGMFAPVSCLFSFSAVANILAYGTALDAGTIKILGQLRLPLAAVLSVFILKHRYSQNHWLTLVIVTCASLVFYLEGVLEGDKTKYFLKEWEKDHPSEPGFHQTYISGVLEADIPDDCFLPLKTLENLTCGDSRRSYIVGSLGSGDSGASLGLIYVCVWAFIATLGSLLSEKLLKSTAKVPFYVQKMHMEMTGVFVNVVSAFLIPLYVQGAASNPSQYKRIWWHSSTLDCDHDAAVAAGVTGLDESAIVGGNGLFENWFSSPAVICQLIFAILQAWTGGIVVKKFSAVVKNIAKSISLVLTVMATQLTWPYPFKKCYQQDLPMSMYLLAIVVFSSTILFSQLPKQKPAPAPELSPAQTGSSMELRQMQERQQDS